MTDAPRVFDEQAVGYESQRRRLIPPYDAFYGTAVDALSLAGRPLRRVLDIGAGTGLLARRVAGAYPDAELTLLDGAPAMLEQARGVPADRARCTRLDRWSTVEQQLAWLRQAGFADADCLYKDHCFAVLVARRSG